MFYRASDIISCRALFFIIAFYIGLWTIRIPTIKDQLLTNYVGVFKLDQKFYLLSPAQYKKKAVITISPKRLM